MLYSIKIELRQENTQPPLRAVVYRFSRIAYWVPRQPQQCSLSFTTVMVNEHDSILERELKMEAEPFVMFNLFSNDVENATPEFEVRA